MLISPLMNPIIAMGYSLATYDGLLLRNAALNFMIQIIIALIGEVYTPEQIATMKANMAAYGLEDYSLEVVQDIRTSLFNYFEKENNAGILEGEIVIV